MTSAHSPCSSSGVRPSGSFQRRSSQGRQFAGSPPPLRVRQAGLVSVQEPDRREHTAVIVIALGQRELHHDAVHVSLDRALCDPESSCDPGVRASLGHQREHLALARRQLFERITHFPRRNELLNKQWVNDRSTTAYASNGVEKLVKLGDPALEQIAAPAAACQQRHRLRHLHVRRQEQDRHLRKFLANQVRRLEALRPMIWRHADVDDGQIRLALANEPDQLRPVACPADDLVPALLEQAREALAHQHVIVGDDDSRAARIDFGHGREYPAARSAEPGRGCRVGQSTLLSVRRQHERSPGSGPRRMMGWSMPSPWLAVEAGTDLLARARQIQRSWESLLVGGALDSQLPSRATAGMRRVIVESWRRVAATGLDPIDLLPSVEADPSETRERWLEHPLGLLQHVLVEPLQLLAEESNSIVQVTDPSGLTLFLGGPDSLKERAAEMNLVEGARCSETVNGTNGVGTALAENHPVQVFGFEHFSHHHREWVCSGAPIHDPVSGRLVGVIDLTSPWKIAHPRSLELVTTAARTTEQCLLEERRDRDARLRRRYC